MPTPEQSATDRWGVDQFLAGHPLVVVSNREPYSHESNGAMRFWRDVAAEHALVDRTVLLGVDRLHYTKGIPERLDGRGVHDR